MLCADIDGKKCVNVGIICVPIVPTFMPLWFSFLSYPYRIEWSTSFSRHYVYVTIIPWCFHCWRLSGHLNAVLKLGRFAIQIGDVNICDHYHTPSPPPSHPADPWNLPGSVIAPRKLWNSLSQTILSKYSCIGNKGLLPPVMTITLKSNLYVEPINYFPNFWHRKYDIEAAPSI